MHMTDTLAHSKRQKTNGTAGDAISTSCISGRPSAHEQEVIRISKAMSKLLRHSPPAGTVDSEGWMNLPVLLTHLKGRPTAELVRMAVHSNDKQRFVIDESSDPPRIRATQGHSVALDNPILAPVTSPQHLAELLSLDPALPLNIIIIHVTGEEGWAAIQEAGELRRMSRTHIHFATRPNMMRRNKWASVWLMLDLQGAMEAGHSFHLATNQVLLTEGPLPLIFVDRLDLERIESLPEEWRSTR